MKRPTKLDIPVVASLTVGVQDAAVTMAAERDMVEVEGRGFAVYCRRGRREHMEDHYSASVDLHGQPKEGDYVDIYHGVWRIQGSLTVSRGIGDRHLK
ncbi:putative PPM-type phosphatase domain, protein phosphatase 2C family [Lupinus albus]|uniref:Putative PPM-type phosphatase domain, protein phosphatase 2C family n=1 Tax=Lupinus albus TaxID=3870 RepID=A0A6A4NUY1_LUPAL|nr:putative PPM-type phosphatase domain, protein phosphatase 2C family [Lupinus albus]